MVVTQFGYSLLGEQSGPRQLVDDAIVGEAAGFDFITVSDHFYPWLDEQGHSPYAWSVLGAMALATTRVELMSFVTCPIRRYHPVVVAQKAATMGVMSNGRFVLGLGAGENLNEHVVGDWPQTVQRHEMLAEALDIINGLLAGKVIHHSGQHFQVSSARLWDLPPQRVPVAVAVSGPASVKLAAAGADALIATEPKPELIRLFDEFGGAGRPRYGQVNLCYGPDEAECRRIAHEQFRWTGLGWPVNSQLPDTSAFAAATKTVTEQDIGEIVACGPDLDRHLNAIRPYLDAGFTHLAFVQIGARQSDFLDFAQRELLPALHST
jgi:G6PDH family F420-dependent oxidoreductase